jgi:hypothetical protein
MPFNYQTLKNYTTQSVVDGSITAAEFTTTTIAADRLELASVTEAKLASAAVDFSGAAVTGTLSVAKGGLGITSFTGAARAVQSDGSAVSLQQHGIASINVYTSSSTWSRPTGVKYIKVQVNGAGGGGGGHGEGGAAGGYAELFLNVTAISSVAVTIGGGGGGTYYSGAAGNGNASSFGAYVSASGGHGANRQAQHCGGVSGVGSGGNLNIHTGGGYSHHARDASSVAESFFGGGTSSNYPNGGQFGHNHNSHSALGAGGGGAHFHSYRGTDGRGGIIIVTNFY